METPGAQMLGCWKFNCSIIPHAGGWENAYREAHNFVRPLRAVRVRGGDGSLPPSGSPIYLEPAELILSTLKPAEEWDGVVARLYNIANRPVTGRVRFRGEHISVERVNMNEEEPESLDAQDGHVELSLRPNEIMTLKFKEVEHA